MGHKRHACRAPCGELRYRRAHLIYRVTKIKALSLSNNLDFKKTFQRDIKIAIYLTVLCLLVTMTISSDCLTAARKSYPSASGPCGVRKSRHPCSKPSRALSRCLPTGYAGNTWHAARRVAVHGVRPSNQMSELCHRRRTEQRAARWLVSSQTPHQNQVRSISQRPAESKCKRRRAVAAMSWWRS